MDTPYRTTHWTPEAIAKAKRRGQWPPREQVLEWLRSTGLESTQAVERLRAGLSPHDVTSLHKWLRSAHPDLAAS
jgi:hypothetical protein